MLDMEKRHGIPLPLLVPMLTQQKARYSLQAYQKAYSQWRQSMVGAR